jgi:hypothetical protein
MADIGGQFNALGARFESKDQLANFNGLKVGQHAIFQGAIFSGPVIFASADIAGQFIAA